MFTYSVISDILLHPFKWVQKKQRQRVVDFGTVSKASAVGGKSRAPLIQGLFAQGTSDKAPVTEVCVPEKALG